MATNVVEILVRFFNLHGNETVNILDIPQFHKLVKTVFLLHFQRSSIEEISVNVCDRAAQTILNNISRTNQTCIKVTEFLEASLMQSPSCFDVIQPPLSAVLISDIFHTRNHSLLNEIFPFTPAFSLKCLEEWQNVPRNCETILSFDEKCKCI